MRHLIVLNDPPYGTERSYNGLRLAMSLLKHEGNTVDIFLMADAIFCAKTGQKTPDGYYNLQSMLKPIARKGNVMLCGTCMDARGMQPEELIEGARRSSMIELTEYTMAADKVLVF